MIRSALQFVGAILLIIGLAAPANAAVSPTLPAVEFDAISSASNESAGVSGDGSHVIRVAQNGSVVLTQISSGQEWVVAAQGRSPVLSDDGRFVSYVHQAAVYRWDRSDDSTTNLSIGRASASGPSISDDGTVVAWHEATGGLGTIAVWDSGGIATRPGANPLLSGNGQFVVYSRDDFPTERRWDRSSDRDSSSGVRAESVSDDGNVVAGYARLVAMGSIGVGRHTFDEGGGSFTGPIGEGVTVPFVQGDGAYVYFSANLPEGHLDDLEGTAGRFETYRTNFTRGLNYVVNVGTPIDVSDNGNVMLSLVEDAGSVSYRLTDFTPLPSAPSPEQMRGAQLSDQVVRLYSAYFGREPDAGGLEFWRGQRAEGMSISEVSQQFAGSPEFAAAYGDTTDAEFVELVYRNVLDRLPDDGGRDFWLSRLAAGVERGSMMTSFSESPEYVETTGTVDAVDPRAAQIWRLFRAYFERDADQGGFDFWYGQLLAGRDLSDISSEFARSPEFVETYGDATDAAFIELVYRNVLDRSPDQGGREFWTAQLDAGVSRGSMMTSFSESPEYILSTGTVPIR